MRKTLATLAALTAVALLTACGNDKPAAPSSSAAAPSSSAAVSEPPADVAGEEPSDGPDATSDLTGLKVGRASKALAPEGNTVEVDFTLTNSAAYAVTYAVTLSILDGSGTQVGSVLIDTGASEYGPTKPGAKLHVDGRYGMTNGNLPEGEFKAEVGSVDKLPA